MSNADEKNYAADSHRYLWNRLPQDEVIRQANTPEPTPQADTTHIEARPELAEDADDAHGASHRDRGGH